MTAGAEPAPRRSPVRRKRPRARGESGAASTTPDSPSARPKTANRDDATLNAVRPPPPAGGWASRPKLPGDRGGRGLAVEIYLIRHGQTPNNITGERLYNACLTDLGRVQAERLAATLSAAGLTAVLCSPLLRAMETAAPIALASRLPLDPDNDLVEFNRWDPYLGATRAELAVRFPAARLEGAMPASGWAYAGPEPVVAALARVWRVLRRISALPSGSAVAIVAHGTFNALLLAAWLGIDPFNGVQFAQDNACINRLTLDERRVAVRCINDTRHLYGVASPPV